MLCPTGYSSYNLRSLLIFEKRNFDIKAKFCKLTMHVIFFVSYVGCGEISVKMSDVVIFFTFSRILFSYFAQYLFFGHWS